MKPTLSYQPPEPGRRWRRLIRRIAPVAVLLLVALMVYLDRADLSLRAQRLYWYHRCATHVTPPGTVLVEEDPVKAAQLIATNGDYVLDGRQWGHVPRLYYTRFPRSPRAAYWPADFRGYVDVAPFAVTLLGFNAVAFMGGRTSPCGNRRLVVIPYATINQLDAKTWLSWSLVIAPPGAFGSPGRYLTRTPAAYSGQYIPLWLQPGQADPADASHISIDFTTQQGGQGRHGTLDIHLRDDDTLDVNYRDPAATQGGF